MSDTVNDLIAYTQGELDQAGEIALFQDLINSGLAWRLEGSVGRRATELISAGACMLGEKSHRDYYGNRVPARHEVRPGTKGSPEYVAARSVPVRQKGDGQQ